MQSPYRLPHPLPPLPVRKGVRGRRPKSQTIAMLKAVAEAAAAASGTTQNDQTQSHAFKNPINTQLMPKPHKKRGPKPGSKRKPKVPHSLSSPTLSSSVSDGRLSSLQTTRDSGVVSTVCVYVNKHGVSGPHLDRKLLLQLPDHFGPGPVNTVLQHAVQACVDCAFQPKVLFSFLQSQSDGGEIIRVHSDGGIHYVKLPTASSASFVLRFLETLCHHLQCDNLFSSQPFSPLTANTHTCYDRSKSAVKEETSEALSVARGTRRFNRDSASYTAAPSPKLHRTEALPSDEAVTHVENGATTDQQFSEESMDSSSNSVTPRAPALRSPSEYHTSAGSSPHYSSQPPPLRRLCSNPSDLGPARTHRRLEAASSTTGPDQAAERESSRSTNKSPSSWSIEEVMQFVRDADPQALGPHAELFRKHEIDGKALILLRSDMIMKYMGLKLGPALKLCHHIEKLKQTKL